MENKAWGTIKAQANTKKLLVFNCELWTLSLQPRDFWSFLEIDDVCVRECGVFDGGFKCHEFYTTWILKLKVAWLLVSIIY